MTEGYWLTFTMRHWGGGMAFTEYAAACVAVCITFPE